MFRTLSRSWEYAKLSYRMIWDHKQLMIFPVLSTIAAIVVLASFIGPLAWGGQLEQWIAMEEHGQTSPMLYVLLFLLYFCNYFVIVFFNGALTACALQVLRGEEPTLGHGLRTVVERTPQVMAWALVSAVVGVLLQIVENAHEKVGEIVSALLGSAWTALTYFVIPVIVVEGVGPIEAFKRSTHTLKSTWGTALMGNFSMGFVSFLLMLPLIIVAGAAIFVGVSSGTHVGLIAGVVVGGSLLAVGFAATSAADGVFKAVLWSYATGQDLPQSIEADFGDAFASR